MIMIILELYGHRREYIIFKLLITKIPYYSLEYAVFLFVHYVTFQPHKEALKYNYFYNGHTDVTALMDTTET